MGAGHSGGHDPGKSGQLHSWSLAVPPWLALSLSRNPWREVTLWHCFQFSRLWDSTGRALGTVAHAFTHAVASLAQHLALGAVWAHRYCQHFGRWVPLCIPGYTALWGVLSSSCFLVPQGGSKSPLSGRRGRSRCLASRLPSSGCRVPLRAEKGDTLTSKAPLVVALLRERAALLTSR